MCLACKRKPVCNLLEDNFQVLSINNFIIFVAKNLVRPITRGGSKGLDYPLPPSSTIHPSGLLFEEGRKVTPCILDLWKAQYTLIEQSL